MYLYRCYSGAAAKLHFFFVTARRLGKFYEAVPAILVDHFRAWQLFITTGFVKLQALAGQSPISFFHQFLFRKAANVRICN